MRERGGREGEGESENKCEDIFLEEGKVGKTGEGKGKVEGRKVERERGERDRWVKMLWKD